MAPVAKAQVSGARIGCHGERWDQTSGGAGRATHGPCLQCCRWRRSTIEDRPDHHWSARTCDRLLAVRTAPLALGTASVTSACTWRTLQF